MKTVMAACLGFCLLPALARAQEVFAFPLTAQSRPEVTAVAERMASHAFITASFTQTKKIARLDKTFRARGRMIFDAGRGLVWETKSPFPGSLLMTKDALKQKTAGGETSVLAAGDNDTFRRFAGTMQAVFNGDFKTIEADFEVFFTRPAPGDWIIGLKPRDKTLAAVIRSLELRGRADLSRLSLREANGDTIQYAFTDIAYPARLSPADEKAFF